MCMCCILMCICCTLMYICCTLMCICCTYVYLLYLMCICCILWVFVVSNVYLLYLCVFVVSNVYLLYLMSMLYLMCICCTFMCICCTYVYLLYYVRIDNLTLDAGLLARSQYPEGPATGHLDTGFSWFPCVYKRMLRWFPSFQVATTCFSCSPPDLNFLATLFFIYVK